MSSVDNIELAKRRKKKKCNCIIILLCLFCGTIIYLLSYGAFRDSKFYEAPTDECRFTNTTSTTEDCRSAEDYGCNGLQRKFYYTTLHGTCEPNELYDYSECDCNDNPATFPNKNHVNITNFNATNWNKCWIISCETNDDWTFIEPMNGGVLGWILLIVGLLLLAISIYYFCNCLSSKFEDNTAIIKEIGEKEAYDRFYKGLNAKEGNDRPVTWTILHRVVISLSIGAPVIMIGSFLIATFSYGANLYDNTISTGIQYRKEYNAMFRFTEAMTMLSTCFASFVSWCRQIQISVYFSNYAVYFGTKRAKIYRWFNVIAVVFNVIGYLAILQLVSYDSARALDAHKLWAGLAFLSTGTFLFLTMVITIKQRYTEYCRNKIVDEQDPCIALRNTFWYDAAIMLTLFVSGVISLFVYFAELGYQRSNLSDEEKTNTSKYVRDFGNTAEWTAFFCLVSGISVLALSFHHDHIAWEIHEYLKQEVMLWPFAEKIFKFLGCCCCCCCEVGAYTETLENLEKQIGEDESKNDDTEMNTVDGGKANNDGNNQTELVVATDESNKDNEVKETEMMEDD